MEGGDGWEMVAFPAALWNRREAPGAIIRLPARGATPPEGAKSSARRCNADLVWLGRVGRFTSACVHWGCFLAKILFEHRSERIHSIWRKWGRPTPPDFSQLCVCFSRTRAYHGIGPRVLFWPLEKAEVAVDILTNLTRRKWLSVDFRRFLVRNLFRPVKSPTPRSQFNPSAGRAMAVRATHRPTTAPKGSPRSARALAVAGQGAPRASV